MTKHRITDIPRPIIKWAGGKTFSAPEIVARMPKKFGKYYEPFFGGGAVFFELYRGGLLKNGAVISDTNRELIDLLTVVRDEPVMLTEAVKELGPGIIDQEKYVRIRDSKPDALTARTARALRAARTLFINKTCFNGLYRVNKKGGRFNVGWNKKTSWAPDYANIFAVHEALQCAEIRCVGYQSAVDDAEKGDVVYLDPPYFPASKGANFVSYTRNGFTHANHLQVAATFSELAARRVTVLASNADVPIAREIYGSIRGATIHRLEAPRRVNSDGKKRGLVGEILVVANGNKKAARAAE